MSAGRPTDYNKKMLDNAGYYLENHKEHDDLVPSVVGLAGYLGKSKSTIYLWGDTHPEFSDILSKIVDKQERMLISGGLGNDFNSAITKLMLGKHGYHDKQDLDHSGGITFVSGSSELGKV